jgi:hypothetical protein
LDRLFNKSNPEKDLGPHDVIHGPVNFLFFVELFGPVENFLELHNQRATGRQPVFARHLLEHFINNHECGFGAER